MAEDAQRGQQAASAVVATRRAHQARTTWNERQQQALSHQLQLSQIEQVLTHRYRALLETQAHRIESALGKAKSQRAKQPVNTAPSTSARIEWTTRQLRAATDRVSTTFTAHKNAIDTVDQARTTHQTRLVHLQNTRARADKVALAQAGTEEQQQQAHLALAAATQALAKAVRQSKAHTMIDETPGDDVAMVDQAIVDVEPLVVAEEQTDARPEFIPISRITGPADSDDSDDANDATEMFQRPPARTQDPAPPPPRIPKPNRTSDLIKQIRGSRPSSEPTIAPVLPQPEPGEEDKTVMFERPKPPAKPEPEVEPEDEAATVMLTPEKLADLRRRLLAEEDE